MNNKNEEILEPMTNISEVNQPEDAALISPDPSENEGEQLSRREIEQELKEKKQQLKSGSSIKDAWKQVETFGQALSTALQGRGNVVMVRVNDEALHHLDMLVEANVTKSRSESAAFLINEGIKDNQALFGRISEITDQITELRQQLREMVTPDVIADIPSQPSEDEVNENPS